MWFTCLPCNNLEVEILHKISFILKNRRQQQVKYKRNILDYNLILDDSYLLQQPIPPPAREHHSVLEEHLLKHQYIPSKVKKIY